MSALKSVCVYCGSGFGGDPAFEHAARALGRALAEAGLRLVYGGGNVGLMGTVAHAALQAGGHVTGVIPDFLKSRERMLEDIQETIVVGDMHTRKKLMFDRSDAFVALPGGIGTLEELVEQLTWAQLGQHKKPILLLSIDGFWEPLLTLLDHMRGHGFIREGLDLNYLVAENPAEVVSMLREATVRRESAPVDEALVKERFGRLPSGVGITHRLRQGPLIERLSRLDLADERGLQIVERSNRFQRGDRVGIDAPARYGRDEGAGRHQGDGKFDIEEERRDLSIFVEHHRRSGLRRVPASHEFPQGLFAGIAQGRLEKRLSVRGRSPGA